MLFDWKVLIFNIELSEWLYFKLSLKNYIIICSKYVYILLKYLHVLSMVFWYHSWISCHVFLQEKSVLVSPTDLLLTGKLKHLIHTYTRWNWFDRYTRIHSDLADKLLSWRNLISRKTIVSAYEDTDTARKVRCREKILFSSIMTKSSRKTIPRHD